MRKRQYKKNNTDKSKKVNSVRASKKIYRESKHKRIKSKKIIRTPEERQQLLLIASIQSNGRRINYRLKEIEKEYGTREIFANKEFLERARAFDMLTPYNNLRLGEKFLKTKNNTQLKMIDYLLKKHLKHKTSNKAGIKEVIDQLVSNIGRNFKFTTDQISKLLEMFRNENLNLIYKHIDPSQFWAIVEEAEKDGIPTKERFLRLIEFYGYSTNNLDFKEALEGFYVYMWGSEKEEKEKAFNKYYSDVNPDDYTGEYFI
jgi:hypothetical protein